MEKKREHFISNFFVLPWVYKNEEDIWEWKMIWRLVSSFMLSYFFTSVIASIHFPPWLIWHGHLNSTQYQATCVVYGCVAKMDESGEAEDNHDEIWIHHASQLSDRSLTEPLIFFCVLVTNNENIYYTQLMDPDAIEV